MSPCQVIFYSVTTGNDKKALAAFVGHNFVIMGFIGAFCHLIAGTSACFSSLLFLAPESPPKVPPPLHHPFILHVCYCNYWTVFGAVSGSQRTRCNFNISLM